MATTLRIIRPRDITAKLGLSRAHVYRLEAAGKFPRRVRLGPGSVGWVENELDVWISERIAERDSQVAKAVAR